MAWARSEFHLSKPSKDGKGTVRDEVTALALNGIRHHLLDRPELPPDAAHLWEWFQDLSCGRTAGMALNPITWEGMDAWARFRQVRLRDWEITALKSLDMAFLEAHAPKPQKEH